MISALRRSMGCCLALLLSSATYSQTITLYSYHNHPPFVTGEEQGLTFDLARQLNVAGAPDLQFEVRLVPRSRLNLYLSDWINGRCPGEECDDNWMVPWVNPAWGFTANEEESYLWWPLFNDANRLISHRERPIEYLAPESLARRRFGGIRGHHYVGIDPLVTAGRIERLDGNHERENLLKLLHGRIDATILPTSTLRHLLQQDPYLSSHSDDFHVATRPHQQYRRFVMLPASRPDLQRLLSTLELPLPPSQEAQP